MQILEDIAAYFPFNILPVTSVLLSCSIRKKVDLIRADLFNKADWKERLASLTHKEKAAEKVQTVAVMFQLAMAVALLFTAVVYDSHFYIIYGFLLTTSAFLTIIVNNKNRVYIKCESTLKDFFTSLLHTSI